MSTMASPKIHSLSPGESQICFLLRVGTLLSWSLVVVGEATKALLSMRPVGNSKFPTAGSYWEVRGCPRGPENDEW